MEWVKIYRRPEVLGSPLFAKMDDIPKVGTNGSHAVGRKAYI